MAADAVAGDIDVIEVRRQPAEGAVTVIAVVAAGDMRRVFAGGSDAVMAGTTAAKHLGVIDRKHWREHIGRVTVFTDVRRLHVRRIFAGRAGAVMAAGTVCGDSRVIEIRR